MLQPNLPQKKCASSQQHNTLPVKEKDSPKNVAFELTNPVSLSANNFLYASKLVNRMAIFGTIPVTTAPRPLYNASGVSRFMMSAPVVMKPRFLAPLTRARRESCMRTLMVSGGIWRLAGKLCVAWKRE